MPWRTRWSPSASRSRASRSSTALLPAIELEVVWRGGAFAGFEKRLQADQEDAPLGAAVVHELHRLLPALVFEKNDGPVAFLFEIKTYFCADPFCGSVDHLPQHALGGIKLKNLHIDTAGAKAEFNNPADLAFASRVGRPPAGKTIEHGQCLIGTIQ